MMHRLLAILAVLGCCSLTKSGDWPQWLGPRRDGGTSEAITDWKTAPKTLWSAPVGAGFSSPVVADGKVLVHARVGEENREEVIAFDDKSGKVIWRKAYDRGSYSSALNTGPQATPTVAGGRLYTYGVTGILTCYQVQDGEQLWQVNALKKFGVGVPQFGVCCSPLVIGNRVIVAVGGKGSSVVAFDAKTGEVAWQVLDEAANTSSPVLLSTPGRSIPDAVFMTTLRVVGLNPIDGAINWEYPLPFQPGGTSPTPVVSQNLVVTSTMDNGSTGIRVSGQDNLTAERVWQSKDLSGYFSSGVAVADRIFLVTNTLKPIPRADLVCVQKADGKLLWKKEAVGYFHFGIIRTGNNKLLILDDAGNLKLLDADATKYQELCQAKVCAGTFVTPALANGRLYARDSDKLVCIELNQQ